MAKGKLPVPLEADDQAALFQWAAYYPQLKWMHSSLNGAFLHGTKLQRAKQWGKLKKQGAKKGILDIFLPMVTAEYPGLYVEMKRRDGSGSLTDEQAKFKQYAEQQGYKVVVCEGTAAAIHAITDYASL